MFETIAQEIESNGFCIIPNIYSSDEIGRMAACIQSVNKMNGNFRTSGDLFAIRRFLKEIPESKDIIFNRKMNEIVESVFGKDYFSIKSIYFDKPGTSNWFVAYHQDLTISVDEKKEVENFTSWTIKNNQFSVQPPLKNLENIFTVRIHLDDTDGNNGALNVIPGSHRKGIFRSENINWNIETESTCCVSSGGVMIMKPLLMHSSSRTTNNKKRRVIHIEFSNIELPGSLSWAEKEDV